MAIDTNNKIELEKDFFSQKTIIIGKSGSGKSFTGRVFVEEGQEKFKVPTIIIDPQDAHLNHEGFEYIKAENVKSAKGLGLLLSQTNQNIVIRTKRLSIDEQNKFLHFFLTEFRKNIRKGIQIIIIDEIHKFAPEKEKTFSKDVVRGMFQENRSDGLGIIGLTQRAQRLDKTILSQADNLIVGRVTSFRDKESVKPYLDDIKDVDKFPKLETGEFYLTGDSFETPTTVKIRKCKTKHSGDSPKNLLTEDKNTYKDYVHKFVYEDKNSDVENDNVSDEKTNKHEVKKMEEMNKLLPSKKSFMNLASKGMKMSIGMGIGGLAGTYTGSLFQSPIPVVSSRTLGSGLTTLVLYAGHKMTPSKIGLLKDSMEYATAGSAVYTVGSATFDVLNALNVKLPMLANFALSTATGVQNMSVEKKSESGASVDTDTQFA